MVFGNNGSCGGGERRRWRSAEKVWTLPQSASLVAADDNMLDLDVQSSSVILTLFVGEKIVQCAKKLSLIKDTAKVLSLPLTKN